MSVFPVWRSCILRSGVTCWPACFGCCFCLLGADNQVLAKIGAVLLLLATAKEMWQRFTIWWHSLLGKACILTFYAIVLNFSFAYAESIVNGVLGIRPNVVPYSVNLAAIVTGPGLDLNWQHADLYSFTPCCIYLKSCCYWSCGLLAFRRKHLLDDEVFPVWTLIARIIYLPVVTVILVLTLFSYFSGHPEQLLNWGDNGQQQQNNPESLQKQLEEIKKREAELQQQQPKGPHSKVPEFQVFIDDGYLISNSGFKLPTMLWLNKLVASFNYHVESMGASSCKLTPPEHLVHINDYEVLVITPDATQPVGYSYKVRVCDSPAFPAGVTGRALLPVETKAAEISQ